ncbi:phospholipase D family protein [Bdellovibrio bacteriovorus]|uniref:phospholipase D family protein n=1 Tax=Bdellovibrio bacteriovorus TaxID=959 RepID=UPI0035A956D4
MSFYSLVSCQSVPMNFKAPESYALTETSDTYFGKFLAPSVHANPGKSGFYPLQAGTDAFVARLESVRRAEKSLDVQYYIWHDDLVGKMLFHEILAAADRHVRVRLLLDDLHIGQYQDLLLVLDSHPYIEVRMFNPFTNRSLRILEVFRFSQINRRMHNKVLIADNQTSIIGGRNIGNEYFTASRESNFGDFDVWCFGPVVAESSHAFDLYWNHRLSVPISVLNKREVGGGELSHLQSELRDLIKSPEAAMYTKEMFDSNLAKEMRLGKISSFWGKAKVFSDSPEKVAGESYKTTSMLNQVTALPIKADKEIFIVSPYFIPGKKGVDYFKRKHQEGVKVTVFTNSLASNDVPLVFAGYKKYRKGLLKAGVEIYEMRPKVTPKKKKVKASISAGARLGLHGKAYVFDRRVMFVGSMNLDPRSVELNSEMGVLFESPELAQKFVELTSLELPDIAYKVVVDEKGKMEWITHEGEKQVRVDSEPETSIWKSFEAGFLSLFVPESML